MHPENSLTVTIPAMPGRPVGAGRDTAETIYDLLLWVLGIVSATVSAWSISTLLHDDGGMPWGLASLGVGVYDLLAFMAGLMVYIRRHEPHRAVGPQILLFAAVAGSAYVNYVHGYRLGGDLVALLLGAAPVTFEIAFAMRHNVMSLTTAILFPRNMWRMYKRGVHVKLHTGSLPVTGSGMTGVVPRGVPEPAEPTKRNTPESLGWKPAPREVPEAPDVWVAPIGTPMPSGPSGSPERGSLFVPEPAEPELTRTVPMFRKDGGANGTSRRKPASVPEREEVPEVPTPVPASGYGTRTPEQRVAEVAEDLRNDVALTGAEVGLRYGISDSLGRRVLKQARAMNEGRP